MGKRPPLDATDRRRQAGHKRPKHLGVETEEHGNGAGGNIAHLFNDRRKRNAEGKRAF